MCKSSTLLLAGILLAFAAAPANGSVTVDFRPGLDSDPARREALAQAAEARILQATDQLRRRTDCRLDPRRDHIRLAVGTVTDADSSVLPACYTFPDSTIRVIPEYLAGADSAEAGIILDRYIRLEAPAEEILAGCPVRQRREVRAIVSRFLLSELMHECYHDWQNRQARFPEVDKGKSILNRNRGLAGSDWRTFLQHQGVDLREHDRQMLKAELECCSLQAAYWRSFYGPDPIHPLARAFSHLMDAAVRYYHHQLRNGPK